MPFNVIPCKNFLYHAAIQETVETSTTDSGLVEIGYISSVHGLQGEICVKSSTDFPELRFSRVKHILTINL